MIVAKARMVAMETERDDLRRRALDRLITFADAIVAIAATLLVLPLVETVSSLDTESTGHLLSADRYRLLAFALSFVVIWRFWLAHHVMYEQVIDFTEPLIWCNFIFLLGIVFLPFPTEILGAAGSKDVTSRALYIGTLLLITAGSLAQQWIITRNPALQAPAVRGTFTIVPAAVTVAAVAVALIVAVAVPAIGIWSLLILTTTGAVDRWIQRRRA
jgi:uncharacterized membrane protein